MRNDRLLLRLGELTCAFTGWVPPASENSFLPQFLVSDGSADVTVEIYYDPDIRIPAPKVYEDAFCRAYVSGERVWLENSAFGTMKTWAYSILHYDHSDTLRLQILSPTSTFKMDHVIAGMMIESLLLARESAILHSSVIAVDGQAILFTAPSGTGKSTQAELWRKHRNAEVLNGDRALLRFGNGKPLACGLPFAGTSGICNRFELPIRAIVFLSQAKENRIERMRPTAAVRALVSQISLHKWHAQDVQYAAGIALRLAECLPIYHLACLPEESAVECLEAAMKGANNGTFCGTDAV
ncbi:MAG: hypothetical protein PUF80_07635 [Firmicutes bacterium]|nr:hypothetical protein [Bacillota bacterium]